MAVALPIACGMWTLPPSIGVPSLPAGRPPRSAACDTLLLRPVGGFLLSQQQYPDRVRIAEHRHSVARFTFVLTGRLTETLDGRPYDVVRGEVQWMPPMRAHAVDVEAMTSVLLIEIESAHFTDIGHILRLPARASAPWGTTEQPLRRLMSEMHNHSPLSDLALQGLIMQLIAGAAREMSGPQTLPPFMERAVTFVADSVTEPITSHDVAAAAGMPVEHMRAAFRRFFGSSITEFIRRRRIERAMDVLATSDCSLADLAADLGFCDQPHLARVFKQVTGTTPAKFRRECRRFS
ncbi:MAG TPA: AraC family transcriptional regulator [Thermoanaerobaculia bacterium]|nr:AraC family transcriptional regulator [Thermoanaerobaculia bacterium]